MRPAIRIASGFLLIVVLAAGGAAVFLRGARGSGALDAIPHDAALVLQAPDMARLARAISRTALSPFPGDAAETLRIERDGVAALFASAGVPLPAPAEGWLQHLDAGAALAVVQEAAHGGSRRSLLLASHLSSVVGPDPAALRAALLSGHPPGGVWSERRHRGRTYSVLRMAESPAPLCVASSRRLLLITTSGSLMRRALDTLDGRRPSLSRDPAARAALDRLPRRADLYIHVDGDAARGWLDRAARTRPWLARASPLAGLSSVRHAALSMQVRQGMFHERLFLTLSPEGRGLPGALLSGPARAEPRHLPRDPRYAVRMALSISDAAGAWRSLPRMLSAAAAEIQPDGLADRLAGLEDFLDIDVGREVFGAVGRDVRLSWGRAGPLPRSAPGPLWTQPWKVTVGLRNPGAARSLLRRADGLARAIGSHRSGDAAPGEVSWYELPGVVPLTPAYRLEGRLLHVASSPGLLIERVPAWDEPSSLPPGADRARRTQAHVHFQLSSSRLADAALDGRTAERWTAAWDGRLAAIASGTPPLSVGSARMERSGLLLEWVSPVSLPLMALIEATRENPEKPDEEASLPFPAAREPLY